MVQDRCRRRHTSKLFLGSVLFRGLKDSPCLLRQVCVQIVQALLQAHDRHQLKLELAPRTVIQLHVENKSLFGKTLAQHADGRLLA